MMFHAFSGLGQAVSNSTATSLDPLLATTQILAPAQPSTLETPQGSVDTQYCNSLSFWDAITDATCWQAAFSSQPSQLSIPQAALIGAGNAPVPTQAQIDSQTPEQTINQTLASQQAGYVAGALAAAAGDTGANPPSGICTVGSPNYSAFQCWLNNNLTYVGYAGLGIVTIMLLSGVMEGLKK
jgi:hypothetical protein